MKPAKKTPPAAVLAPVTHRWKTHSTSELVVIQLKLYEALQKKALIEKDITAFKKAILDLQNSRKEQVHRRDQVITPAVTQVDFIIPQPIRGSIEAQWLETLKAHKKSLLILIKNREDPEQLITRLMLSVNTLKELRPLRRASALLDQIYIQIQVLAQSAYDYQQAADIIESHTTCLDTYEPDFTRRQFEFDKLHASLTLEIAELEKQALWLHAIDEVLPLAQAISNNLSERKLFQKTM